MRPNQMPPRNRHARQLHHPTRLSEALAGYTKNPVPPPAPLRGSCLSPHPAKTPEESLLRNQPKQPRSPRPEPTSISSFLT